MINFIVAMDENKLISINNKLPWHIPEDLNYFKNMTTNKVIIMGLNTFKSIGGNPLKNRLNIVLTNSPEQYKNTDNLIFSNNLAHVIEKYQNQECFIIGGGLLFKSAMKYVEKMYITWINKINGDFKEFYHEKYNPLFFPDLNLFFWKKDSSKYVKTKDNMYECYFNCYSKI